MVQRGREREGRGVEVEERKVKENSWPTVAERWTKKMIRSKLYLHLRLANTLSLVFAFS